MELAQQQRLLARLYTNSALRQRFFAEPQAVLRELGMDASSASTLAAGSPTEIQFFAHSLQRKRLGDVAKVLPRTRLLLDGHFETLFLEYADKPVPPGPPQGRADALAFASFVQRSAQTEPLLSAWAAHVVRYEAARLRAIDSRFLVRFFRYPVRALQQVSSARAIVPPLRPQTTFACWFRLTRSGRLRQISLSLPWWGVSGKPLTPPPGPA